MSGTPLRLKSRCVERAESAKPSCSDLPASSSMWMRVMPTRTARPPAAKRSRRRSPAAGRTGRSDSPWAGRDRSSSCGRRSRRGWTSQPSASAARDASSTASPVQHRQRAGQPEAHRADVVFGSAPNRCEQPQKIFVAVSSCAWISSPMTGSNAGTRASDSATECYGESYPRLDGTLESGHHAGIELRAGAVFEFGERGGRRDRPRGIRADGSSCRTHRPRR